MAFVSHTVDKCLIWLVTEAGRGIIVSQVGLIWWVCCFLSWPLSSSHCDGGYCCRLKPAQLLVSAGPLITIYWAQYTSATLVRPSRLAVCVVMCWAQHSSLQTSTLKNNAPKSTRIYMHGKRIIKIKIMTDIHGQDVCQLSSTFSSTRHTWWTGVCQLNVNQWLANKCRVVDAVVQLTNDSVISTCNCHRRLVTLHFTDGIKLGNTIPDIDKPVQRPVHTTIHNHNDHCTMRHNTNIN